MKPLVKNFLIFIIIFLIISGIFSLVNLPVNKIEEINLNTLVQQINQGIVKSITIDQNRLNVILNDDRKEFAYKEGAQSFSDLIAAYQIAPAKLENISIRVKNEMKGNVWSSFILPILLPFLIFAAFFYFMIRQIKGAGTQAFKFGESHVKKLGPQDKKVKTTFKDVAGVKEAKEELQEVVEFLKSPAKFTRLGAKIPKGVLLVGPTGTGKTLLARAVAGEANVAFFHISGSEFVELFVGVGASRVRNTFQKAKKSTPAILFIDEIDAVGRQRGAGLGGGHDEREQTLNQILVELDGFDPNIGLVVMAATNRPDILDSALLRPGRFDRKVILTLPDIKDREEILKIHSCGKPLAQNVSLKKIAGRTPGFSGADLANLMNEAAILTARRNKEKIGEKEVLESIEKVLLGPERKSHILSEKEKKIVAYHEAGHALVAHLLPNCDPVQKISIIARGQAAGYTFQMPESDKYLRSKSEFLDNLSSLLGGYLAEKEVFNEVTTGAANDLKEVTSLARRLVTEYGMSEVLGPRTFGDRGEPIFLGREITEQRDYSEKFAQTIDEEVSRFINLCYNKAREVIQKNRDKLEKIAQTLLEKETLEKKEFEKLFQ